MNRSSFICSIARTPIGSFQGVFSSTPAVELGAIVIKSVIEKSGILVEDIDELIMGNVLSAAIGQAPARQAAIYSGLSKSVQCMTINKVCGSGLKAVMLADQAIRCGDANIIIAGGMENMSQSPYYLLGSRSGMRMGHKKVIDSLIHDGLWDPYSKMHMGNCAEVLSKEKGYSRESQDKYALQSYKRSINAIINGLFKNEIVPVTILNKFGDKKIIDTDEEPYKGKLDKFSNLKPAFDKDGSITVANASSINDGAAALSVISEKLLNKLDLDPICRIVSHVSFAHDPLYFTTAPSLAIDKVLKKANLLISDIDLFEINEAFSNVVLDAVQTHSIPNDKININGGAISLGHPIGASGARILVTLISNLLMKQKKYGLASICIGGGEAVALIIEIV